MEGRIKEGNNVGKYLVEKLLGEGSHGKVFKCVEFETNTIVAIKEIGKGMDTFSSYQMEKKILEEVKGEYIAELLETFEEGNCIYLVYKYCPQGDLSDYLKRHGGKLDEKKAQLIMTQIVAGYDILYKHNIIHRDIKPGNFLVTYKNAQASMEDKPTIKMTDLGESRQITSTNSSKTLIATYIYMAPELLKGIFYYDYKVDIWAMGIILYYLLHNCLPFKGYMTEVLEEIEVGNYLVRNDISRFCLDFMNKCLQYDTSQRISFEKMKIHPFITGNKTNWKVEKAKIESEFTEEGVEMLQLNVKRQLKLISNPDEENKILSSFEITCQIEKILDEVKNLKTIQEESTKKIPGVKEESIYLNNLIIVR